MLYNLVQTVRNVGLEHFFHKICIRGTACEKGPLIIVAPHPFSFMDPMVVTYPYRRVIEILAKGTIFENPWHARLFRKLHMHPIYRKQDKATMAQMKTNLRTLKHLSHCCAQGGAVLVFAEGQSLQTRRTVDGFFDGVARIGLDAQRVIEDNGGGNVNLQIVVPTYSSYIEPFNTTLTIDMLSPESLVAYRYAEGASPTERRAAYEALTEHMHKKMYDQFAKIEGPHAELAEKWQMFWASKFPEPHKRITFVGKALESLPLDRVDPAKLQAVEAQLDEYHLLCSELMVWPGAETMVEKRPLPLLVGWAFARLGYACHYVPYRIVRWCANKDNSKEPDIGHKKLTIGALCNLTWYSAWGVLLLGALLWAGMPWYLTILAVLGSVFSGVLVGYAALRFLRRGNALVWRYLGLSKFKRLEKLGQELRRTEAKLESRLRENPRTAGIVPEQEM